MKYRILISWLLKILILINNFVCNMFIIMILLNVQHVKISVDSSKNYK